MKKIIMGVGIPGSGKTAVLKSFAQKNSYTYICPDEIRFALTGDSSDQTKNREVWDLAYSRTEEALKRGKSVVFDAVFAYESQRKDFIEFAKNNGAEKIQGVYIKTPLEIAKERNANRERQVPEQVVEKMNEVLESKAPNIEDGFDSIFVLDENQKMQSVELRNGSGGIKQKFFYGQQNFG